MKKSILFFGVGALAFTSACGTEADGDNGEEYTFELGHVMASSFSASRGYEKLDELLQENSEGDISLDIYDSGAIGSSDNEVLDAMNTGTIDMSSVSTLNLSAVDSTFNVLGLPHLINSNEDWDELWESEVGDRLEESLEDNGYKMLMLSDHGFRHTVSNNPVSQPEDLQGMNLRATDAEIERAFFDYTGANSTTIGWAETYTALNQGTVDGHMNALPLMTSAQHQEAVNNLVLNKVLYSNMVLLMDLDEYNQLPEEVQETLEESIQEANEYDRQYATEDEEEALDIFRDEGVEVHEPTEEELTQWQENSLNFWSENLDMVDEELLRKAYEVMHDEELEF